MAQQVTVLKTQMMVAENELAELKNISKDVREMVMEFANLSPAVENMTISSRSGKVEMTSWTFPVTLMSVVLRC